VFGGLDRFAAARAVKAVGGQAGLRPPAHPHLLRHTLVSQLLAAGVPVREVQLLAGHASLATTQRYADALHHSNRQVSEILRDRFAKAANTTSTW
jgi:integrase/recombinase XerD